MLGYCLNKIFKYNIKCIKKALQFFFHFYKNGI